MKIVSTVLCLIAGIGVCAVAMFFLLIMSVGLERERLERNAARLEFEYEVGRTPEKILDRALELGAKEILFTAVDGATIEFDDNNPYPPEERLDDPEKLIAIRAAQEKVVDYNLRFIFPTGFVERWIVWVEVREGKIAKASSRHLL